MKVANTLRIIGLAMALAFIGFMVYALGHPEAAFSGISAAAARTIYLVWMGAAFAMMLGGTMYVHNRRKK